MLFCNPDSLLFKGLSLALRPALALMLGLVALAQAGLQAKTVVKLGTLAPVGSTYHKILMEMGESWKKESEGQVQLRIYAGGKAGGEAEMVGLMMTQSLQASVLTAVGLAEVDVSARGLQVLPMAFDSLGEVDHVGEALQPLLEELLLKKGFVVLFWTDVGWVRFFSRTEVRTPDDVRKQRLFTWSGDTQQMEIVKSAGFNIVPIETADIVPSLQTGLIDVVPMPPFFALAGQVDKRAPFMMDLDYAPLVGACVVSREAWDKIPEGLRRRLAVIAREAGQHMKEAGRKESLESEQAMVARGMQIVRLTPEEKRLWREMAAAQWPKIRERLIPAPVFDKAMEAIREYRAREAK